MTMNDSEKTGNAAAIPSEKSSMTLFRDDRQEDVGAIILSIIIVTLIVVLTT
jgi:hypothetical protein